MIVLLVTGVFIAAISQLSVMPHRAIITVCRFSELFVASSCYLFSNRTNFLERGYGTGKPIPSSGIP